MSNIFYIRLFCRSTFLMWVSLFTPFLNLKVIKDYLEWDDDFLKALSVLCLSALVDESENAVLETGRSK